MILEVSDSLLTETKYWKTRMMDVAVGGDQFWIQLRPKEAKTQ